MKKIFLTFVLAAFAAAASAQGTPKKPSCAGFVSNGFWDNWEISIGAGAGTALSSGDNLGSFGKRVGYEADFSITKWMHPIAGVRFQLQGGCFNNVHPEAGKMTWPYMFAHGDLMINFSNWAGGYRPDRAYYAVPFIGLGYMASNFTDKSHADNMTGTHQCYAFTYGLLNKFRLSPSFDFNIELKGMFMPSRMSPARMDGAYLYGFNATLGFTYRFNKRGWERGVAGYTADDIRAFQEAVAMSSEALCVASAENELLAEQLNAARAETKAAKAAAAAAAAAAGKAAAEVKEEQMAVPSSLILFNYSMSSLTPQEKTRLEVIAERIRKASADQVYKIVGYADQQTGTKAGNKRVAENRARRVYDFLVSKSVNPKQLTYEGMGNAKDIYKNIQKANRAAVIK